MSPRGVNRLPDSGWKDQPAVFAWTEPTNKFNTWCFYRQEDVPEPGCSCPLYLSRLGYSYVRTTDTCVTYFEGKTVVSEIDRGICRELSSDGDPGDG